MVASLVQTSEDELGVHPRTSSASSLLSEVGHRAVSWGTTGHRQLLLTDGATVLLLLHTGAVNAAAEAATHPSVTLDARRMQLIVDSAAALVVPRTHDCALDRQAARNHGMGRPQRRAPLAISADGPAATMGVTTPETAWACAGQRSP